jgi:hypothetical protein
MNMTLKELAVARRRLLFSTGHLVIAILAFAMENNDRVYIRGAKQGRNSFRN